MPKRLQLFSNSTMAGEPWLQYPLPYIKTFLEGVTKPVVFVPYAGVTMSWDAYTNMARERFESIGHQLTGVHQLEDIATIKEAGAIVVGGGNTFNLTHHVQKNGLIGLIQEGVANGIPYIGWSAGSNLSCPTLCTTNDMPIIEPQSFNTLHLIPFQINPHYLDAHPDGHAGETREQRILEFVEINPAMFVAGVREGGWLEVHDTQLSLHGSKSMRLFKKGQAPKEYEPGDDINFLMA